MRVSGASLGRKSPALALVSVLARMLRPGYIPQKSYHILAETAALAQLLHCLMQCAACPMDPCAEADSRSDAGSAPAAWKPKQRVPATQMT
jgi:hypothetical protein